LAAALSAELCKVLASVSAVSQRIIWPSVSIRHKRHLNVSCVFDDLTNCYDIVSNRMPFAALCVCKAKVEICKEIVNSGLTAMRRVAFSIGFGFYLC